MKVTKSFYTPSLFTRKSPLTVATNAPVGTLIIYYTPVKVEVNAEFVSRIFWILISPVTHNVQETSYQATLPETILLKFGTGTVYWIDVIRMSEFDWRASVLMVIPN